MQAQETETQQPARAEAIEQPYETLQVHPLAPRELIERIYWHLAETARRERPGIESAERVAQLNAAYFALVEASRRRNGAKKRRQAPVPQEPEPVSLWSRVQRMLSGEEAAPQVLVDPYELLKIDRGADSAVIQIAYDYARAQSKGPTLDRVEALRRLDDAYALVTDSEQRSAFDEAHPLPVLNPQTEDGAHVVARIQGRDAALDADNAPPPVDDVPDVLHGSPEPKGSMLSVVESERTRLPGEQVDASEMVRRAIEEAERAFAVAAPQSADVAPAPHDNTPAPAADLATLRHAIDLESDTAPGAPDEDHAPEESSADAVADAAVEERIASLAQFARVDVSVLEPPAPVVSDDHEPMDNAAVTLEQRSDVVEVVEPKPGVATEPAFAPVAQSPAEAPAGEAPAVTPPPRQTAAPPAPASTRSPLLRGLVSRIGRRRDRFDDSGLPPIAPQSEPETPELARIRERLRMLRSESPPAAPDTRSTAFEESPAPASAVAAYLVFVGGDRSGQSVALDSDLITLGTSPRSRIILPDHSGAIEREHARIWRHGDHFLLREADGTGTLIGGRPLEGPTVVLEDRDVIAIGSHRLRFETSPRPQE